MHLAGVVSLLLCVVDEASLMDLVTAEGRTEVDGSFRARRGRLQVKVVDVEAKVVAGELETVLGFPDLQRQVLKVEGPLQAIAECREQVVTMK